MADFSDDAWFAVRCILRVRDESEGTVYEERVTLWTAADFDEAVGQAEIEASNYAADVGGQYLGLAQAFALFEAPSHGAEVFSLMRTSTLDSEDYLNAFFDTGCERTSQ